MSSNNQCVGGCPSWNAVDGDRSTSVDRCTTSAREDNPWWAVKLLRDDNIAKVVITNRATYGRNESHLAGFMSYCYRRNRDDCNTSVDFINSQSHRIVRFLDRTIGCDWARVRPIGNVCYDLQEWLNAASDLYAWSRDHERSTNDWRRSMARSIVGNRATSGSDQRPIERSVIAFDDRSFAQSWRPAIDRTINRDDRRSILRLIVVVGSNDRSHDQSCNLRTFIQSIVAPNGRSYNQSWHPTIDRTINRGILRPIVRAIGDCRSSIIDNWWCHHAQLMVRSLNTYLRSLTIWNRRFEVLNMNIHLAGTDCALVTTHDLCDQSCVLSKISHDSNMFRSHHD